LRASHWAGRSGSHELSGLKQLKAQQRKEYLQRIPIEGKFGQGKNGYNLNAIRAKRADTSTSSINSIFLVMNLLILLRVFFALGKRWAVMVYSAILCIVKRRLQQPGSSWQPALVTG
jgi:IS5 family transposase